MPLSRLLTFHPEVRAISPSSGVMRPSFLLGALGPMYKCRRMVSPLFGIGGFGRGRD